MHKKYTSARFYLPLIFLMLVATSYKLLVADTKSEVTEFAKKLLGTIQTGNFDAYKQLLMTNAEFTDMVMASQGDEESKMQTIASYEEGLNEDKQVEFDELVRHMKSIGVDFNKIVFKEIVYDEYEEYGIKVISGGIYFTCGEDEHLLTVLSVFKTKNGWKMSQPPKAQEPKEKDETCNAFTKQVLTALGNKDEKAFYDLVLTDAEFLDMLSTMEMENESREKVKEEMATESPQHRKETWYTNFLLAADEGKIDLQNALPGAEYSYEKRTENNVAVAMCGAKLVRDTERYWISFIAVKTKNGWKLVDRIKLNYDGMYEKKVQSESISTTDSTAIEVRDLRIELEKIQRELDSVESATRADSIRRADEKKKVKEEKKKKKNK
ncbi:MAG TPA: hypothetical protein VK177_14640 [Flavobacteriales bacterium]|nr:hypothetical protein [Flavobacteriales bacterium]